MKTLDFIKEYEYKEISDKVFESKRNEEGEWDFIEIRDPSYRKYNAMGMICSWLYGDQYKAKKVMSRKQFKRLNNRILRRLKKKRGK